MKAYLFSPIYRQIVGRSLRAARLGRLGTMLLTLALWALVTVAQATDIVGLRTEYMDCPLGIDVARPNFSWQMQSPVYGAKQSAYRLMMATSVDDLAAGRYTYDTGRVESDQSVCVAYAGPALRPTTRYNWKVCVWDQTGQAAESQPSWLETGLLGTGWQDAQWIGSPVVDLSRYRSRFSIDYDFVLASGSTQATFLLGGKSDRQYVSLTVDASSRSSLIITHTIDGQETVDFTEALPAQLDVTQSHHVRIDVDGPATYSMHVFVDGQAVLNTHATPVDPFMLLAFGGKEDPYTFAVSGDSDQEPNANCRLHQIGFCQAKGQTATFSGITVSENAWNTVLYRDDASHTVVGKGRVELWQPAKDVAAPQLRKTFTVDKAVKQARLYATARGIYEAYINGQRVSDDRLNPGWTDYRRRIMYNTYDVTALLCQGTNGLGAVLGTGWYCDHLGSNGNWQDQYGVTPSFLAMLVVEYEDGTRTVVATDDTWRCTNDGRMPENSLLNGEEYDARREIDGWSLGSFDDSAWAQATVVDAPAQSVILQGYVGMPVGCHVKLQARSVSKLADKTYVYDLGQNMAGVPRISGIKGKAGQTLTIHYAEMLYPEVIPTDPVAPYTIEMYQQKQGQLYLDNYRSALSTDRYTLRGLADGETYEPRLTSHGFRYLSIEGLDEPLPLACVEGIVLESIGDQISDVQTSSADINQLFQNAIWGQRGNFLSVPTDCPQRDERLGWSGDAHIFARSASYNMQTAPFYTRWMNNVRDEQTPSGCYVNYFPDLGVPPTGASSLGAGMTNGGWREAGVIVPWQMYQQYGDLAILEEHYPSMLRFMESLERDGTDYIQPAGGFGDWLALDGTNTLVTNTAYAAYAARIMQGIAKALGHEADAQRFGRLFDNIRQAFVREFITEDGLTVISARLADVVDPMAFMFRSKEELEPRRDAQGRAVVDTQTSYVLPLYFGLLEGDLRQKAADHLAEAVRRSGYTLTTGFVGTPYICQVLSDNGYSDLAYRLFLQTDFPSWLFPVHQGATTFWERWNSYTVKNGFGPVSMNSFNHYSYGAIEEWMMSHMLGIERDETRPGYQHILFQPEVGDGLDYAQGGFETMYGRVSSGWKKEGKKLVYTMTVPANTTATIALPTAKGVKVVLGKEGIAAQTTSDDRTCYQVGAGNYSFEVKQ